ncbi:MAG: diaminopimelate decarboxylase [Candidatus Solibacter usitatus]|nr:diaminopimelate decarboxylase [Candidatus Solibacter usitatus]
MQQPFAYRDNRMHAEDVPLDSIARRAGTPCFVYSSNAILGRYHAYDRAFGDAPHRICYAVKANGNLAILSLLAGAGAGFDIVSGGELFRVLRAGGAADKVVFAGVGKTAEEVEYALEHGIHSFSCESEAELSLIDALASRLGTKARVSLRVNPDVDAVTHPKISTGLREHKFGIDIQAAEEIYARARWHSHIQMEGVSCHIGSQLLRAGPLLAALDRVLALVDRLREKGIPIQELDLGGGLGIPYRPTDEAPSIEDYVAQVKNRVAGRNLTLLMEPGRSLVGEAGVLLSRVLYRKTNAGKEFVILDAAMNDLIRPSLYEAHHEILPVKRDPSRGTVKADVVGPVCETGDYLARDRELANVLPGDLVAISTAGAYGFVMSSNYNARPRAAEVMVAGDGWRIVRQRETFDDIIRGEMA